MKSHILAPLVFGIFSLTGAALLLYTFFAANGVQGASQSYMYPRVILVLWTTFALVSFFQALKQHGPAIHGVGTLMLTICAMTFLCVSLVPLGFLISGVLFFVGYSLALGYRRLIIVLPSAVGTTVLLWLLFEKFLEIPLPLGILSY